jgi:hypothetical protein
MKALLFSILEKNNSDGEMAVVWFHYTGKQPTYG